MHNSILIEQTIQLRMALEGQRGSVQAIQQKFEGLLDGSGPQNRPASNQVSALVHHAIHQLSEHSQVSSRIRAFSRSETDNLNTLDVIYERNRMGWG